jgi:hemerythrin
METDDLPGLTIGINIIDEQHGEFLTHLKGLRDALSGGVGSRDRLMRTLRYLDEYMEHHFGTEERYMRLYHYPGILLHQREHTAFRQRYEAFKQKVLDHDARGELTAFLAVEVERDLEAWLADHILKIDRKMGDFLSERM